MTAGVDVGDSYCQVCILDETGEKTEESRIATTRAGVEKYFSRWEPMLVALEVGTHSPWIAELIKGCGHRVMVANARRLRMISENDSKNDEGDAEILARVARFDPSLLFPIEHRSRRSRADLATIRSRAALVATRTNLINHIRGVTKSVGERIGRCSTESFHKHRDEIPDELLTALGPVVGILEEVTGAIKGLDRVIEAICRESYPETKVLRTVPGVGPVTSLSYILTLEEPGRFRNGRAVGAYLGLRPRQDKSGTIDKQLRITKAGDGDLRRLLVGSAHYILGPHGPDSDLKRWGLALTSRGGKNAKKRAVVAVARKLAGVLFHLWRTGEEYRPFREARPEESPAAQREAA
jgi:transposase